MPEIATFGKRFYFYKSLGAKKVFCQKNNGRSTDEVNKAAETRRLIFPTSQPLARRASVPPQVPSRWEDNPLRTGAAGPGCRALHVASAVALWDQFAFAVRIRRDDHSAAGG